MTIELIQTDEPRGILLFAAGAGGDPMRYRRLLEAARDSGFILAAPVHERFDGRAVSDDKMRERAVGLKEALAEVDRDDLPVVAAGHSAGAWACLCLAGARPWGRDRQPVDVPTEPRVERIVLLAPPLGWFQGPGALDGVRVPMTAIVGESDVVTPASTVELLRTAPGPLEVLSYEGVGHFDFMSQLPPGVEPSIGPGHDAFLDQLAFDFVIALGSSAGGCS